MAEPLVIVENPGDWKDAYPALRVVTARDYLAGAVEDLDRDLRVINLARDYSYLSVGYYISLLAEARGHRVIPSVRTMQDLSRKSIYTLDTEELERIARKTVGRAQPDVIVNGIELMIYFGESAAPAWQELARQLFDAFRCPVLRVELRRQGEWRISAIQAMHPHALDAAQQASFAEALSVYVTRRWNKPRSRTRYRYDLAILHDADEQLPPSDRGALKKMIRAGKALGVDVDLITRKDYGRLAEYDALFIRETTNIDHYTYRFAKKAESEGMVVIDDPDSILRCTNKVYLAELLKAHRIPRPKTVIVSRENVKNLADELGFPLVLKIPDGSFSRGVVKAENPAELKKVSAQFFRDSDLILAQEFMYTDFDWRVGILNRKPLFVCQYFMSKKHWQIVNHATKGAPQSGGFKTFSIEDAPPKVVKTALRAANLVGDGLYGVDMKQIGDRVVVIEVNDNPNIDSGVEDLVLGDALYTALMAEFVRRIEGQQA
ncbi:RimK family protein [Acidihalobacter ferrooxydans]|uniref:Carboxylate--amine ligase n=1 Tax=Acidihalobacter ferrooxydans TaxID=1765967 RepID=A0A1P8UEP4_9GAMM|nr:RimK family protein [Acidihalobacter ferrooxydans]APZ42291.1 carboxylate--amine ligase [Acidihalobacter ferrooxydans]